MAGPRIFDRVKETCTAPGTGTVSLLGAATGFQSFGAVLSNGDTTLYCIADQSGGNWEVGLGTWSTGNNLARSAGSVLAGSAGAGNLTDFSAGTQNVFLTLPAQFASRYLHQRDTLANRPSATSAGILYFPSDAPYVFRDNGSTWDALGPFWKLTPPVSADFAWVNQGTATLSTANGFSYLENLTSNGGAEGLNIRKKSAPATPYTVTMALLPQSAAGLIQVGMLWRDAGTGKLSTLTVRNESGAFNVLTMKYTNPTTFSAVYTNAPNNFWAGNLVWMRLSDDGVDRKFQLSRDGYNFQTIQSVTRTDFHTPDEVGFYVNPYADGFGCSFLSYLES
jgi:hypothetical protein